MYKILSDLGPIAKKDLRKALTPAAPSTQRRGRRAWRGTTLEEKGRGITRFAKWFRMDSVQWC